MFGTIVGQQVTVLKDDGCNTNVISKSFVKRYCHLLQVRRTSFSIFHSNKQSTEEATHVILDAEIQLGNHVYRSNWIVAGCRYDILLGMPWHIQCVPSVDYKLGTVKVGESELPTFRCTDRTTEVHNIGVKKFRSLTRRKTSSKELNVYQLCNVNNLLSTSKCPRTNFEDENCKS